VNRRERWRVVSHAFARVGVARRARATTGAHRVVRARTVDGFAVDASALRLGAMRRAREASRSDARGDARGEGDGASDARGGANYNIDVAASTGARLAR
jgi:hypothetical protein